MVSNLRSFILQFLSMNLTAEQQTIVHLAEGRHLVLAPPGTGKTEILSQRISYALSKGISPKDMVCLTFTNRAAKSMNERVKAKFGETDVFIGNIHTFCLHFLKEKHAINNATLLLDEDESASVFREALEMISKDFEEHFWSKRNREDFIANGNGQYHNKSKKEKPFLIQDKNICAIALYNRSFFYDLRKYLCFYYNRYIYEFPVEALKIPFYENDLQDENIQKEVLLTNEDYKLTVELLFEYYDKLKREVNGVDFDDLLGLTYYFISNPKNKFARFKWLQVDEVQDLNPVQWEIIKNITYEESHIVYFGDYEQAIYSFLDAKLDILHEIEKNAKVHNFTKNFRSPEYLLNYYIKFCRTFLNPKWKKDPIPNTVAEKDKISLCFRHIEGTTDTEEKYISYKILPNLPSDETKAILVRTNKHADDYGKALEFSGFDFFKISGFDIMKYAVVKTALAILFVLSDKNDRSAWIRIFYAFSNFETLREARNFIISSFSLGVHPTDFIYEDYFVLEDFRNLLENDRIIVFDTETTGLDTENDDIIQIAAVEILNGKIGKMFNEYILTEKPLGESVEVHKIQEDFLKENGIAAELTFKNFIDFVGESPLVAHNLSYDQAILKSNFQRFGMSLPNGIKQYDSIDITKRFFPDFPSYKLAYLIDRLKVEGVNSHNAEDDVKATANLLFKLFEKSENYFWERSEFLKNNRNTIKAFRSKFMPFFKDLALLMDRETTLSEVFKKAAIFCTDQLNIEVPRDIFKITNFMDHISTKGILRNLLSEHIYDFATYKESDLVTGKEKIIISTVHKAKGLEFQNVIIPSCYKDNLPHYMALKSGLQEDYDEESRLFYVAISRSKKRLILTCPTDDKRNHHFEEGKTVYEPTMISLYVQLMEELLDWKTIKRPTLIE